MNDYFDQFERSMGTALAQGAHDRWYARLTRLRHGRTLAVVFGALVIGTPAGPVSSCFGACVPAHHVQPSASVADGTSLPGGSQSVVFRVVDPRVRRASTPRAERR